MNEGGADEARRREAAGPGRGDPSEQSGTVTEGGEQRGPESQPIEPHPTQHRRASAPAHVLRYVARSDRGLIRATNQDSVFAGDRLLVIADGMGGHAAGDTASRLVVGAFAPLNDQAAVPDLLGTLLAATREGNDAIAEMVAENPDLDGMGTTVTAMLFDGSRVGMAHVGDSRAYLYRSGVLHQLTHDDTFVQSLVDDGRITENEAAHHPQRNLLLRALNGTDLDPALALREVRAGDRYLLCSDGLSGVVDAEHIADTLADPDPERAADVLIQRALLRGGPDNVTVIVADVVDTGVVPIPGPVTVAGAGDPDATGPIQQLTREMPRVPLPPIPEVPGARAEVVPDTDDEGPADFDDEDFDGDDFDSDEDGNGTDDADEDDADGTDSEAGDRPRTREAGAGDPAATRVAVTAGSGPGGRRERVRWHRRGALAVAIIALIGVALGGSTLWVRGQYYVGASNGLVAVYRGVNGSLLGVHFSSFQEDSCHPGGADCTPLRLADLQPAARNLVEAGIQASSLADARNVMSRLSREMLPICPSPTSSPSATGTAGTPGPSASGSGASGSGASGSDSVAGTGAPATGSAAAPSTGSTTSRSVAPTTTEPAAAAGRTTTSPPIDTSTASKAAKSGTTTGTGTKAAGTKQHNVTANNLNHRLAPTRPSTVTVEPAPTTMTVRTTITDTAPGLLGGALGAALAPATRTTAGAQGSTDGTATDGTATGTHTTDTTGGSHPNTAGSTTVTAATPTITVTQTVTAGPTITATPLAPAPAVPGVTCRTVG